MAQKEIKRRPGTERGDTRSERRSTEVAVAPPDARSARSDARSIPRAVGQELTTANKILVAAAEIDEERETFTAERLDRGRMEALSRIVRSDGVPRAVPGLEPSAFEADGKCRAVRPRVARAGQHQDLQDDLGRAEARVVVPNADRCVGRPTTHQWSLRAFRTSSRARRSRLRQFGGRFPAAAVSAKPERSAAFTSEPRVRTREAPPSVAAAPAAAATRAPEPRSITRGITTGRRDVRVRRHVGVAAIGHVGRQPEVHTRRAGHVWRCVRVLGDHTRAQSCAATPAPQRDRSRAASRRVADQSAAAPIRINDRLEVTLTSVIGLPGLHKMLTQKYHRELENSRGRPSTEDES